MKGSIEKNVLDLNFQKQLAIASTTVIIAFTYIIGVGIAILARQITLSGISLGLVAMSSIVVFGLCWVVLYKATRRMRELLEQIRNLTPGTIFL